MKTQIILNANGDVAMVVHDAKDSNDPAWNPKDCTRIEVNTEEYAKCTTDAAVAGSDWLGVLLLVEPYLDGDFADVVSTKIEHMLDAIAVQNTPPAVETPAP